MLKTLLQFSLGCLLLLSACASEPTEEIAAAEAALNRAKQAEASEWAPEAYREAEEKMTEARQLVEAGQYEEAIASLNAVKELARDAVSKVDEAKQAAQAEQTRAAEETRRQAEAEEAARRSHTVVSGEYLWRIAGLESAYGDPYQWTRIYNANTAKIQNPDLIYPGQVLNIPR